MLATDPRMQDIDTDQWRRLQSLFTVSAKARPRIVVIHDAGALCKLAHSAGEPVIGEVDTVDDPAALARRLYEDNADRADFVMVLERSAVDAYYARLQDSWRADEDLDAYVARSFALMDEFADGIVTHPGPARRQLGLQYRFGAHRATLLEAVERHVAPDSCIVLLIVDEDLAWAGLVIGFDADRKVAMITTVDPEAVDLGAAVAASGEAVGIGVSVQLADARRLLGDEVTVAGLRKLLLAGEMTIDPAPAGLGSLLGLEQEDRP